MSEQDRVTVLEKPKTMPTMRHGLMNLASAVAGFAAPPPDSRAEPEPEPKRYDAPAPSETAPVPPAEPVQLDRAVQANRRLEMVAEELSTQVRELARERSLLRLRLAGAFTISAVLAVWSIAAAVLLMQ